MPNNLRPMNGDVLESILHYSKYLYEEENERRDRLNNAVKVYIGILTFILGVVALRVGNLDQWSLFKYHNLAVVPIATFVLFGASGLTFLASFVYTILVLRMWPYKRLRDPVTMAVESVFLDDLEMHTSSLISDYAVACNVNHTINNEKSRLLSRALAFLIVGLILLSISTVVDSMACYREVLNDRMAQKTSRQEGSREGFRGPSMSGETRSGSSSRKDHAPRQSGGPSAAEGANSSRDPRKDGR